MVPGGTAYHPSKQFVLLSPTDEAAPDGTDQLQEFAGGLKNFTKFCAFREVSSLSYGDQVGGCNIVSSIEFDKDAEYFAVAGVTKKIKVCITGCVLVRGG